MLFLVSARIGVVVTEVYSSKKGLYFVHFLGDRSSDRGQP